MVAFHFPSLFIFSLASCLCANAHASSVSSNTRSANNAQDADDVQLIQRNINIDSTLGGLSSRKEGMDLRMTDSLREKVYQDHVKKRAEVMKETNGIQAWEPWDGRVIWDWYWPAWNCPLTERVGRLGDGGKFVCNLAELSSPCVAYSFGVNHEVSFEVELAERSGCEIHAFDPTVASFPEYAKNNPLLAFHKEALGNVSGSTDMFLLVESLPSIMQRLGHTRIDVLKVDVEGAEWDIFKALFADDNTLQNVGQLLIELHFDVDGNSEQKSGQNSSNSSNATLIMEPVSTKPVSDFFQGLEQVGFRAFSREINLVPAFHDQSPGAVEYSFINPKIWHEMVAKRQRDTSSLSQQSTMVGRDWRGPGGKPNAVIFYLAHKDSGRFDLLADGLAMLGRRLLSRYPYPVVIFHEGDINSTDEVFLQGKLQSLATTRTTLTFVKVDLHLPPDLTQASVTVPNTTNCYPGRLGYRHMCRFQAMEAHKRLAKMGYDYHWRLDDDSRFTDDVAYDPFALMQANNFLYGYAGTVEDNPTCVTDLWQLASSHIATHPPLHKDYWFDVLPDGLVFYNNFEISHRSLWESEAYQSWFKHVDASRGIYLHRWGDAPIKTIGVSMAAAPSQVHRFSDMPYQHVLVDQPNGPLPAPGIERTAAEGFDYVHKYQRDMLKAFAYRDEEPFSLMMSKWHTSNKHSTSVCGAELLPKAVVERCSPTLKAKGSTYEQKTTLLATDYGSFSLLAQEATVGSDLQSVLGHRQRGFLGGDVAASVSLPGGEKSVWLMGDVLLGHFDSDLCVRKMQHMVKNGIMVTTRHGPNSFTQSPNAESMCLHYTVHGDDDKPKAFFPSFRKVDKEWGKFRPDPYIRPTGGIFLGDAQQLIIVGEQHKIHQSLTWHLPPSWSQIGTSFVQVANPLEAPHLWKMRQATFAPRTLEGDLLTLFSAVAQDPDNAGWIYLLGSFNTSKPSTKSNFKIFAARIAAQHLQELDFSHIEFLNKKYDGALLGDLSNAATQDAKDVKSWWREGMPWKSDDLHILFEGGWGAESSLVWNKRLNRWLALTTAANNSLILHSAQQIDGDWDEQILMTPTEPFQKTEEFRCYGAKFHEELAANPDEIVLSNVCTEHPWNWSNDPNVYVPSFMTIQISENSVGGIPVVNGISENNFGGI